MPLPTVYVAGPFSARQAIALMVGNPLQRAGMEVTSTWLEQTGDVTVGDLGPAKGLTDASARRHAAGDLADVEHADALVMVTPAWLNDHGVEVVSGATGGRHVEFGYALALGKPVHVLGSPENLFARTHAVSHTTVESLLGALATSSVVDVGAVEPDGGEREAALVLDDKKRVCTWDPDRRAWVDTTGSGAFTWAALEDPVVYLPAETDPADPKGVGALLVDGRGCVCAYDPVAGQWSDVAGAGVPTPQQVTDGAYLLPAA